MVYKNNKWVFIIVFILVLYILKLIITKEISPIVKPSYEYSFKNFLIFTYLFSLIGYVLKITLLFGLFKLSLFVFDIQAKHSILSIVVIGETIKLIFIKGTKIASFYLSSKEMSLEQFSLYESKFNFTNIFNIRNLDDFKYLINFINVFDLIYIVAIVLLFIEFYKMNFYKSFKIIGMPYIIILFMFGIFKTFMSL